MFNVGGAEVLVILLVALLVLGPGKLPEAARQVGKVLTQVRQMSAGFQNELRSAMDDTIDPPSPSPPASTDAGSTDITGSKAGSSGASDSEEQRSTSDADDPADS